MITNDNVLEQTSIANLIYTFLEECPELGLNFQTLEMFSNCDTSIFRTLATYGLQQKYNRIYAEFMRDYAHLSKLSADWLQDFYKTGEYRCLAKSLNVQYDMKERASHMAVWSQFHEVSR